MPDALAVPSPIPSASDYQQETLPQGPEIMMGFVLRDTDKDLGHSTPIPTVETEPIIDTFTSYDNGDGKRSFPTGQVYTDSTHLPSSTHLRVYSSEDIVHHQVGTRAGTEAAKARRRGQRPPRFFYPSWETEVNGGYEGLRRAGVTSPEPHPN
ncbi:hypothetical protein PQX77_012523 [Marasmius sp. AFHP31]|nr:hypothetical protein PQX77_012523 [Marasmius sp. AFHP31]